MARCKNCNNTVLFGGIKDNGDRYCDKQCHAQSHISKIVQQIPTEAVQQQVQSVHQGECPCCGKSSGPIDIHHSHFVWSAAILTSWNSKTAICCRRCGLKKQTEGLFYSLLLGWWGLPWGVIMTPIQIVKNIKEMVSNNGKNGPTEALHYQVRALMAEDLLSRRDREF